jgi:hypothetical protein
LSDCHSGNLLFCFSDCSAAEKKFYRPKGHLFSLKGYNPLGEKVGDEIVQSRQPGLTSVWRLCLRLKVFVSWPLSLGNAWRIVALVY